jgi:hypothetical protein
MVLPPLAGWCSLGVAPDCLHLLQRWMVLSEAFFINLQCLRINDSASSKRLVACRSGARLFKARAL